MFPVTQRFQHEVNNIPEERIDHAWKMLTNVASDIAHFPHDENIVDLQKKYEDTIAKVKTLEEEKKDLETQGLEDHHSFEVEQARLQTELKNNELSLNTVARLYF